MGGDKKVAVITGGSQGIGSALVEAYRSRGYAVVSTARSVKPTNDPDVVTVPGNITDRRTAEETISQGLARFGRIDTLVNNAGIFIAKPFTEYSAAEYEMMAPSTPPASSTSPSSRSRPWRKMAAAMSCR